MATVIQKSAFKPGRYRGLNLSAAKLREFADGTNKALSLAIPIPGLQKHTDVFAADDEETTRFSATAGAGWLKKVLVEDDGAIGWEIDGVPPEVEKGVKDGTIKFTSPEFRFNYKSADGRYEGPIIRHVAFTPLPKAHDQGALTLAMSEGVYQFSEDDFEGPSDDKDDGKTIKEKADVPPPKNPDSPAKATDSTKMEALRECFSVLGAELTSDWTWEKEGAQDELLAALKTLAKSKQEAETKKDDPEEPETKDSQAMPFSEEDIAAMPAPQQVKARKANADAKVHADEVLQFAEERTNAAREKAVAELKSLWLPKLLKQKWLDELNVVQFSEDGPTVSKTIIAAAHEVNESFPPSMRFDEGDAKDVDHSDGDTFFKGDGPPSEEEAEETARRIHSRDKRKK